VHNRGATATTPSPPIPQPRPVVAASDQDTLSRGIPASPAPVAPTPYRPPPHQLIIAAPMAQLPATSPPSFDPRMASPSGVGNPYVGGDPDRAAGRRTVRRRTLLVCGGVALIAGCATPILLAHRGKPHSPRPTEADQSTTPSVGPSTAIPAHTPSVTAGL